MHDPFLKSVFADRRMVGILIRRHVPEWADEIDFATLREEPNELVAGKTLERRYPDLIWSAETFEGGTVLFLIEFQRTAERLMALRTTTYTALALEGIVTAERFAAADAFPEFVYLVLYHGDGPWNATTRVADLFRRSDPGRYQHPTIISSPVSEEVANLPHGRMTYSYTHDLSKSIAVRKSLPRGSRLLGLCPM